MLPALYPILMNRRDKIIERLLKEVDIDKDTQNDETGGGHTALIFAAEIGYIKGINLLLEAGADRTTTNKFGKTALYMACEKEHLDAVKELCKGFDKSYINAMSNRGMTAIMQAARSNKHLKIVKYLTSQNADLSPNGAQTTTLHLACDRGSPSFIREIIKHDKNLIATLERKEKYTGKTPLMCACSSACSKGGAESVQELLDVIKEKFVSEKVKEYILAKDDEGNNTLSIACKRGNLEVLVILCDNILKMVF